MCDNVVDRSQQAQSVRKRRNLSLWMSIGDVFAARGPLLLLLAVALFCEAGWLVFLAPTDELRYECYGLVFWLGSHATTLSSLQPGQCSFLFLGLTGPQAAFHILPKEYPPLTILVFSLPLLAPLPAYTLTFALFMTLVAAGICWLLARSGARRAALVFLLYLVLGTVAVAQERFDLLPAGCTLVCVLAAERQRWKIAYVALAVGILLKLYPVVMLPALFIAEQQATRSGAMAIQKTRFARGWEAVKRWRWRNALLCVLLVCVVMGGFALFNFTAALLDPLRYFLERPPQIESLASSVLWLGGYFGAPYTSSFGFGSLNLTSSLAHLILPSDTLLAVAGLLVVLWLQWRKRIDLPQTLVGLVCVLLTTGKVFSPQYLIWLFPLLAYVWVRGGTRKVWMYGWVVISVLTTLIYVGYYSHLSDPATAHLVVLTLPGFFEVIGLRNLLLLMTTLAFLLNWWNVRGANSQVSEQKHKHKLAS